MIVRVGISVHLIAHATFVIGQQPATRSIAPMRSPAAPSRSAVIVPSQIGPRRLPPVDVAARPAAVRSTGTAPSGWADRGNASTGLQRTSLEPAEQFHEQVSGRGSEPNSERLELQGPPIRSMAVPERSRVRLSAASGNREQGRTGEQPASPDAAAVDSAVQDALSPQGWWDDRIRQTLWRDRDIQPAPLAELIGRALEHSLQVKIAADQVVITQTAIQEERSRFDWSAFVESKWKDTDEPVGSTLTTGGPPRWQDEQMINKGGLRRRTTTGGEFEASQQLATENSNSTFFVPQNQGQTRLALSYRQPLLRGAGRAYNQALIVIAEVETDAAYDQFLSQLQDHLLEITRGYWILYQERAVLLQKRRSVDQVAEILKTLESRKDLDVVSSQLVRAQAAYEQRRASLLRAETSVRNAEARLKMLVNDPALPLGTSTEIVPAELPYSVAPQVDYNTAVASAIYNRPDVARVLKGIKSASLQLQMSQKDLLPALQMVLETYAMGLDGGYDVGTALGNQFSNGAPSYSAGLLFEMPFGNRAAQARFRRRQLEMRQLQTQLKTSLEQVKVDVELAVREVETYYREMLAQHEVMRASARELEYLVQRWQRLPGEDGTAGLMLDDILSAQNVLLDSETAFVRAQAAYNVALVGLQRATGTMLQEEGVSVSISYGEDLPRVIAERVGQRPTPFDAPQSEPGGRVESDDPPGMPPGRELLQTPTPQSRDDERPIPSPSDKP